MDYLASFAISAAGMNVERTRVEVAAMNLANANTVKSAEGVSYRPMKVTARSVAHKFAEVIGRAVDDRYDLLSQSAGNPSMTGSIPVVNLEFANVSPRLTHDPGHPLADERGFVAYAGVDTASEMVTMMSATRAYEANVAAMNTARSLALKTLEIGGNT